MNDFILDYFTHATMRDARPISSLQQSLAGEQGLLGGRDLQAGAGGQLLCNEKRKRGFWPDTNWRAVFFFFA